MLFKDINFEKVFVRYPIIVQNIIKLPLYELLDYKM